MGGMGLRGLDGKVAVVTGAAKGIGAATVARLVAEGCRVLAVDRNQDGLDELKDKTSTAVTSVVADVSAASSWEEILAVTLDRHGRLDCLHNNAGISGPIALIEDVSDQEWEEAMAVNLRSVFLGTRTAFTQFRAQESGGSIVNQTSIGGIQGTAALIPYVATKHAVVGITKTAALEGAPRGIRVNAIAPGQITTPMFDKFAAFVNPTDPEQGLRECAEGVPVQRLGEPDEVADLVAWLFSDESVYVTGDVISIDGGLAAGAIYRAEN
jgi:NAD(P)-dependent dehydrogenase (short-subunit alcohol dehydrogenase family)